MGCICVTEYFLAIKRSSDACYNMDEAWEYYGPGKKQKQDHVSYDSISMKYPLWADS
jgi:hypothetical protein